MSYTFQVAGTHRQVGALGSFNDPFIAPVVAEDLDDAEVAARKMQAVLGFEHVQIKAIVRAVDAGDMIGAAADIYWQARREPGGTITDENGSVVGTSQLAKQAWDQMGTLIDNAIKANREMLRRAGVPEHLASFVGHDNLTLTDTQLSWTGFGSLDGYQIDHSLDPQMLRCVDEWTDGFRWVWTDDERLIFTYCEGDLSGQLFFTPEAFKAGYDSAAGFYANH